MFKAGYTALAGEAEGEDVHNTKPDGPADVTAGTDVCQPQPQDQKKKKRALFWSSSDHVYFTYTTQELKLNLCRAMIHTCIIVLIFLIYFLAWGVCDTCILLATIGSCAASCLRIDWLGPSCWAGFLASLLRGYRIGSEIAHIDVNWKL